jgi:hypothetical protein
MKKVNFHLLWPMKISIFCSVIVLLLIANLLVLVIVKHACYLQAHESMRKGCECDAMSFEVASIVIIQPHMHCMSL